MHTITSTCRALLKWATASIKNTISTWRFIEREKQQEVQPRNKIVTQMIDNSPGIEDYLKYVTAVLLEKSLEEKENYGLEL